MLKRSMYQNNLETHESVVSKLSKLVDTYIINMINKLFTFFLYNNQLAVSSWKEGRPMN